MAFAAQIHIQNQKTQFLRSTSKSKEKYRSLFLNPASSFLKSISVLPLIPNLIDFLIDLLSLPRWNLHLSLPNGVCCSNNSPQKGNPLSRSDCAKKKTHKEKYLPHFSLDLLHGVKRMVLNRWVSSRMGCWKCLSVRWYGVKTKKKKKKRPSQSIGLGAPSFNKGLGGRLQPFAVIDGAQICFQEASATSPKIWWPFSRKRRYQRKGKSKDEKRLSSGSLVRRSKVFHRQTNSKVDESDLSSLSIGSEKGNALKHGDQAYGVRCCDRKWWMDWFWTRKLPSVLWLIASGAGCLPS